MKKLYSLLLVVCMFAITSTVLAGPVNYDNGPPVPQTEKLYADCFQKVSNVAAVNTPVMHCVFVDVGCRDVIYITAITKNENVKAVTIDPCSQDAELTGSTYLRRPVEQYASPWNSYYRSKISKRQNEVIRPPNIFVLTT